jgi:hypothetical protein
MNCNRIAVLFPCMFLVACTHRVPTATVELIDTSMSIAPQAEKSALDAVHGQILKMDRGDTLVLIPITGNAENDAGGRILRLQAPTKRESYDAELRRFRDVAEKQFTAWAAARGADRSRTDILGSLDAARQEIAAAPKRSALRLIVASDFIEDDAQYHFTSDRALAGPATARDLASRLRVENGFTSSGAIVCLGRLASAEFESLHPARKEAMRAFWRTYFAQGGNTPDIRLDGIGMLGGLHRSCPAETAPPLREANR